MSDQIKKVVLAYSGGLDTSAIIPWLIDTYHCEVICACADVGQEEELNGLEERAKASGLPNYMSKISRMNFAKTTFGR